LKNLPIARKLTWMNMLVSGSALLLASAAFLIYEQATFRTDLLRSLSTQAEVIGTNSISPLIFDDPEAANRNLSALQNAPDIQAGAIFNGDGKVVATYAREDPSLVPSSPDIPAGAEETYTFTNDGVLLVRRIDMEGSPIGAVALRAQTTELTEHLRQYLRIVVVVLVISLLAALLVSSTFRREVAAPIIQLAETARRVSRNKDYSTRVPPTGSSDEISVLINSFNEMMSEIHDRDTALENERGRLSAVFDNAPVGIVFAEAPSGRIILGNRRAEEILRHNIYSSTEPRKTFQADPQPFVRDDLPLMRAIRGEVVRGEELQYMCGDNELRWIRVSGAPVRDREGKITAGVVAFSDIDEVKRAEQQLRQAYDRLAIARTTAQMGDWEWELREDLVYLSSEVQFQHGFVANAFDGRFETWMQAIHPGDRERVRTALRAARHEGKDYEGDYRIVGVDGQLRWVFAKANYQHATEGASERLVGVCMDVTTARQAQEALLQSEKLAAAGRLAASISHEINNPLESVTNLLYLISGDERLSKETRTYVEQAEQELMRVSQIASQTLRFYRQSTKPSSADLGALLDSVLTLLRGRFANTQIQIVRQYKTEERLYCFEGEIRQVFANLVGNAVDAMQSGRGKLRLRTADARNWTTGARGLRVTIADTGSGMPMETLARIFEPFYSTKGNRGTGLGLWVSKEIVVKHRGIMQVRSKANRGTVFSIFFPLAGVAEITRSDSASA
ncbi:MAG: ATP-binding protein, partial [Candidatus Korobacteraceae bacterium]